MIRQRTLLFAAAAAATLTVSASSFESPASPLAELVLSASYPTPEIHDAFESWVEEHEKDYDGCEEVALRKSVWLANNAHIEAHNSQIPPARHTLGHNPFSDLTNDEYKRQNFLGEYGPGVYRSKDGLRGGSPSLGFDALSLSSVERRRLQEDEDGGDEDGEDEDGEDEDGEDEDDEEEEPIVPPESVDWVTDGAVTSVKNQGMCGACWAFSAVGAIEGARAVETGETVIDLSMQQFMDCDLTDMGCQGGLMDNAFNYAEGSPGLCTLEDYPFAYRRHWFFGCKRYAGHCDKVSRTAVKKFVDVEHSEAALKESIARQPTSVAVDAGNVDWQLYSGGVLDLGCEETIDHGVLAVGYGRYKLGDDDDDDTSKDEDDESGSSDADKKDDDDDDGTDYWLVKNSWGDSWGHNGYIRIARNKEDYELGASCILELASRPILKDV